MGIPPYPSPCPCVYLDSILAWAKRYLFNVELPADGVLLLADHQSPGGLVGGDGGPASVRGWKKVVK